MMADLRHGTSSLVDQYGLTVLMLDLSISRVIQETYFQLRPTTQVLFELPIPVLVAHEIVGGS